MGCGGLRSNKRNTGRSVGYIIRPRPTNAVQAAITSSLPSIKQDMASLTGAVQLFYPRFIDSIDTVNGNEMAHLRDAA